MALPHIPIVTILILFLLQTALEARKYKTPICPIGFQLAYTITDEEPICYRLKGPEKFEDLYRECTGNLYNVELYRNLNISRSGFLLWTEYRTSYAGGPFVVWSYTDFNGKLLDTNRTFVDIQSESDAVEEIELCVVFSPENGYVAVDCDEGDGYHRYCLVRPYPEDKDVSTEGCEDLRDSVRLWAPTPTCLVALKGEGGGSIRATWYQSRAMCKNKSGVLLNRGWIYSNMPELHISKTPGYPKYPLGVIYSPSHVLNDADTNLSVQDRRNAARSVKHFQSGIFKLGMPTPKHSSGRRKLWEVLITVPIADDNFAERTFPNETSYGLVSNSLWYLVNSSHVFFDVVCEKPVQLKNIDLEVKVDERNLLVLLTNDTIEKKSLSCFTDSKTFHPTEVQLKREDKNKFILKPINDGYYWCKVIDSLNYVPTESKKTLFIRTAGSLYSHYAVKISLYERYTFDDVEKIEYWKKKLQEYIYYYTMYVKVNGELNHNLDSEGQERILREFKGNHSELIGNEKDVILNWKLKKVYLNLRNILVHVELNPTMKPIPPGSWANIEVVYMKPTYNCTYNGHRFHDSITVNCEVYNCFGDFNDGVDYVMTRSEFCTTSTQTAFRLHNEVTMLMPTPKDVYQDKLTDSSEETAERIPKPTNQPPQTEIVLTTDVSTLFTTPEPIEVTTVTDEPLYTTTNEPTTIRPSPSPQDQLQQVIQDLESLLNNETVAVSVDNISGTFDQVDELLDSNVELGIPGNLLHLLDGIGARIDLNGSETVTTVRDNIALLVADAEPGRPIRGLRIAVRDTDMFSENAFEIIRQEVNSSQLITDKSEVVVQLPESVSASSRRISFVVFRNNRAFQNSHYAINSRVLSVNVENITQFDRNEFVDIHLSPFNGDPNRNESRACAFWQFLEDGSGYWSQEGCTFIRATEPGMLDTCRCDHLTHFAEILIPRAVFSERNEHALELLSVIGCCLSIIGLTIVGITALLFRSWRRDFSNKIWLQLCISIFLLVLCFLIVALAKFDTYNIPCMLIGVALHYSVLASFCWMLVAAILSYRRLVLVFNRDASHKLLKAAAFAWGAPCAVVGILLSVDPHSYAGRFEEKSPAAAFCYPSGLALWLSVFTPILAMLLANWTLFVLIVRSVFASRRIQRHGDSHNEALRCASVSCLLVFLFGLPWVFGMFSFNVVAAYFFTLTATLQGFILFLFFVLGNKKTRDLWLNKLKIKVTRKVPVTSSTFTNRSTGTSARVGGPPSAEAKTSKPKSLVAPDSRFS